MRRRIILNDTLIHCYQRTADGGVLFYTYSDHLVYFTHYCLAARKYHIKVLALCQMPDHLHDSVLAGKKEHLEMFKKEVNAAFSRMYNTRCHRQGPVFRHPFGCSPKIGEKNVRSNLIYVANNPVERKLVAEAETYRWNYLAYAVSDHPFSERLVIRQARWPMQKAIREVKALFRAGKPVNYAWLERISRPLDRKEIQQLTDFIISTYNVIDYQDLLSYFGNYRNLLTAVHATTGSEHDMEERSVGKTDALYARMTTVLLRDGILKDPHEIPSLSDDRKNLLFLLLLKKTMAPPGQIAKFLHLKERKS